MALLLAQAGLNPAGQFDLKNDNTIVGGEIGVFESLGVDSEGFQVIAARKATTDDVGPYFLMDDGIAGYGAGFGGIIVRSSSGLIDGADSRVRLGPASYEASGKVTLWDKPGIYAITLDALADDEATLKAAAPGTGMTFNSDGKLLLGNISPTPVAYVIQYKKDESLVTTHGGLINPTKLVIYFNPIGLSA